MRLGNMAVTVKDIYKDLEKFRNPITEGSESGKGRDPKKYPNLRIRNVIATSQIGFGGGFITWTGLSDSEKKGTYPVSMKFMYKKDTPIILSKARKARKGYVKLEETSNGKNIFIPKIVFGGTNTMIKCGCNDFRFRWEWWLRQKGSLIGGARTYKRKNLRPPVNPKKVMGLCKHVNSMFISLAKRGVFLTKSDKEEARKNLIGFSSKTTGRPLYDDMLRDPEYFINNKNKKSDIVSMSPFDYLAKAHKGFGFVTGDPLDWTLKEDTLIDKYAAMMEDGVEFDMPILDYSGNYSFNQEGRHRAAAARVLGIKKIPVMVVTKVNDNAKSY
jgi:hypothetical protein